MPFSTFGAHSGISRARLEAIEDRLKADVLNELRQYDGRLLLHIEQSDGSIVPVWQQVAEDDVKTLQEVMQGQAAAHAFEYHRIVGPLSSHGALL